MPTRFRNMQPRAAMACLLVVAAVAAWLFAAGWAIQPVPDTGPKHGDLDTYAEVIELLQAGQPYHVALHDRLLANGYGTMSVFNWRPPFFLSALAAAPSLLWGQVVLCALAALGSMLAFRLVLRDAGPGPAFGLVALLLLGLAACLAPRAALTCELYGGVLILLSASAYGLKLPWLGFAAGALALLTREIAAPYAVICAVLALKERRRSEVLAWLAVFAAYGVYFLWHAYEVHALLGPEDRAYASGWVQFGGATFVVLTASFNGAFLLLPYWVSGMLLPFAVLGMLAWPGPSRTRFLATVLFYLALFSVLGKHANSYWGALFTPLLAPGLVFAPAAVRDLVLAVRRQAAPA